MMTKVDIAANISRVQAQIAEACLRAQRDPSDVLLVAVSKTQSPSAIRSAVGAGLHHFGENRVEEAQNKIPQVHEALYQTLTWHMIGHIQSRKTKYVLPIFDMIHSIDSVKLAEKVSRIANKMDQKQAVLLEINISGEDAKYGLQAANWKTEVSVRDALWYNMETIFNLPGLDVQGLMTMAPFYDKSEKTRPIFAGLFELRAALQQSFGVSLPELSMGMTNDYSIAIEEGATIVRIGRAIFGPRS